MCACILFELLLTAGSFSKMRLRLSDADLQELPAALGAQLRHLEVFVARMRDFSDQLDKTTVQQIMRERRGQNPPLREVVPPPVVGSSWGRECTNDRHVV